jgi:putative transposase
MHCRKRHRHQEYLDFLKQVDANAPHDLDIHLVVDNYSTHKHAKVKRWLAAHPRYQVHYIPTYSSWLNQEEIWFNLITQRTIRRGTFKSAKELIAKIEQFVKRYHAKSCPFVWTATADSIFEKIKRLC